MSPEGISRARGLYSPNVSWMADFWAVAPSPYRKWFEFWAKNAIGRMSAIRGIMTLSFIIPPAVLLRSGINGLWWVRSIVFSNNIISAGKRVMTETRLNTTPLARTMPISNPMPYLINIKAAKPATVVIALAESAEKEYFRAFIIACLVSNPFALSSPNRWSRNIE